MTPPANDLGRAALNEKDVFGASKCSVEKPAHGGFAMMRMQNSYDIA